MPIKMRAKMQIMSVEKPYEGAETLNLQAAYSETAEDNSYATATPCANATMTIQNPDLVGTFKQGDTFYVDFTPVPEAAAAPANAATEKD